MPLDLLNAYLNVPVFGLVAARLAGLIMFQPLLSSLAIPGNLRVLFVLALAALVTPFVQLPADAPDSTLEFAIALSSELLLGILMGGVVAACLVGLEVGGLLVAQESGLAYAQVIDPNTENENTVVSVFYLQLGVVVFLTLGGHRAVLGSCLRSFDTVPLLTAIDTTGGLSWFTDALAAAFELAVRVAAPTVVTLFLVNVAMGFIARTMPQFNVVTLGFSFKTLISFVIAAAALPLAVDAFASQLERAIEWLGASFG
ncbi:MAG: hypothetical protein CHACPFDD_00999 [Phycisphaerae bacterium]|nr:hypothetical protein [Phycisphaerae bacterium]